MQNTDQPLTNVQLEILKAFSFNLSDKELTELKELLAKYFAERAIQGANKVWDKEQWTDEKVDELLNTKMRKSSQG